jgi:dephospho-CoA kinase
VTDGEPERAPLIGLVGPIGCGKSQVAHWLAEQGGAVIDADQVARDVTRPGEPGHDQVLAAFGEAFRGADGTLDRAALGRIVFADPAALARLEAIVHPLVRPRILASIDGARDAGAAFVVLEAIKLVESGYVPVCDEVWLVTCPPADQQERLVGRGMSPADARQRAAAQSGMSDRLRSVATLVIDTAGSPAETRKRVDEAIADALRARSGLGRG